VRTAAPLRDRTHFALTRGHDLRTQTMMRGKYPLKARQVHPRAPNQRRQTVIAYLVQY